MSALLPCCVNLAFLIVPDFRLSLTLFHVFFQAICSPCLPIGTFFDTKSMKMKHSVQCNKCPASGCLTDIVMHEKLEHGFITNYPSNQDPVHAVKCSEFEGLVPISDLAAGPTAGYMTRLFSSASFEDARLDFELQPGLIEERKVCLISFEQHDVQVCIDFIYLPDPSTSINYSAHIDACFKKRTVPLKLLSFDLDNGYGACSMGDDFNHDNFIALVTALGITEQVDVASFMAMVVSRVCDRRLCNLYCNEIETMKGYDNVKDYHIPMFFHVFNAIMSKTEV
jgi:hypothetical protein